MLFRFPNNAQIASLVRVILCFGVICSENLTSALAIERFDSTQVPERVTPGVTLAHTWQPNKHQAVGDYWVSEKLDGVRAIWDGVVLRTRAGHLIHAPHWFVANFPQVALDGELWIGRGQFELTSATVRKQQPDDKAWGQVTYQVFELPDASGDFTERIATMQQVIGEVNVPWLKMVEQFRVLDQRTLRHTLDEIVQQGGEGLMLHRADALWVAGRTDALLKYKHFDDDEAEVVGYEMGRGQYAGQVGALKVKLKSGKTLRLASGLRDRDRITPPPVGTQVTYRYRGKTAGGLPRFATFLRIRSAE